MGKTLMGGSTRGQNIDLLTPEQQGYLGQAMGGLGQMSQPMDPQQFQQMFQKSFVDPAQQQMQRQTIPGIKEQFMGMDETGSSALNQALSQSATDLSTALGGEYMNQWNQQRGQQMQGLGLLGQLAGQKTFEPQIQQQKGLIGPLIGLAGTLGGAAIGGPAGAAVGSQLGGLFNKNQGTASPTTAKSIPPGYMYTPGYGLQRG